MRWRSIRAIHICRWSCSVSTTPITTRPNLRPLRQPPPRPQAPVFQAPPARAPAPPPPAPPPPPKPVEDFFSGEDAIGTKLDLAKAYLDMGDPEGARSMLDEVMAEGNDAQKGEAR